MDSGEPTVDSNQRHPSPLFANGLAVVFVVAATGIGRELEPLWGTSGGHPYLLQLTAIMVSAWIGGVIPGVVATFLGTLAISFYWIEPTRTLHMHRFGDAVALAIFFGCGIVVSTLAERVHSARRREERLRRARESLLAIVAHDLRNPLSSILLAARALRRRPDELSRKLDTIEQAASRMDSLIGDLVDASVLDREGNLSMTLTDEDVPSLIVDAVVSATVRAAAKSIRIAPISPVTCRPSGATERACFRCLPICWTTRSSSLRTEETSTSGQPPWMDRSESKCRTRAPASRRSTSPKSSDGTGQPFPKVPVQASAFTSPTASYEHTVAGSGSTANPAMERVFLRRSP